MNAHIFGMLLAAYLLVGRWSVGRIDGSIDVDPVMQQPRMWIVVLLVLLAVALQRKPVASSKGKGFAPLDSAICIFLIYLIITGLWAPQVDAVYPKAFELFLMLTVALTILMSRGTLAHEKVQTGFWWTLVLVGLAMAGLAILNAAGGRIHVPGGGPNTFGRNMGLMALGAAYLASRYGTKATPITVAVMIVAAWLILMSGSRGALLSSTVGICILLIAARASLFAKLAIAGVIASGTAVLLFNTNSGNDALDIFQSRIVETTVYNRNLSSRDDLWLDAIDWARERPWFGWGLNGYLANSWTYPHNIFLEVTVEGGCVGLLLLLNVGRAWFSQVRRCNYHVPRVPLAGLALALTAAQTSGDLFDSRAVFLMLALSAPVIALPIRATRRQLLVSIQSPRHAGQIKATVAGSSLASLGVSNLRPTLNES